MPSVFEMLCFLKKIYRDHVISVMLGHPYLDVIEMLRVLRIR